MSLPRASRWPPLWEHRKRPLRAAVADMVAALRHSWRLPGQTRAEPKGALIVPISPPASTAPADGPMRAPAVRTRWASALRARRKSPGGEAASPADRRAPTTNATDTESPDLGPGFLVCVAGGVTFSGENRKSVMAVTSATRYPDIWGAARRGRAPIHWEGIHGSRSGVGIGAGHSAHGFDKCGAGAIAADRARRLSRQHDHDPVS